MEKGDTLALGLARERSAVSQHFGHSLTTLEGRLSETVSIFRMLCLLQLQNQVSICNTVRKMVSLLLWVVTVVALLLLIGLNFNTVLISGAATLSALTVALSELRAVADLHMH